MLGRESRKRLALFAAALLVMTAVAGCATAPKTTADATDEISDPIEPVNRVIFDFNMFLETGFWHDHPLTGWSDGPAFFADEPDRRR